MTQTVFIWWHGTHMLSYLCNFCVRALTHTRPYVEPLIRSVLSSPIPFLRPHVMRFWKRKALWTSVRITATGSKAPLSVSLTELMLTVQVTPQDRGNITAQIKALLPQVTADITSSQDSRQTVHRVSGLIILFSIYTLPAAYDAMVCVWSLKETGKILWKWFNIQ